MNIKKSMPEAVYFSKLQIGDVFVDESSHGDVMIKIPKAYTDLSDSDIESLLEGCMNGDDFYEHYSNAYNLTQNKYAYYDDFEDVFKLIAELEVK